MRCVANSTHRGIVVPRSDEAATPHPALMHLVAVPERGRAG